MRDLIHFIIKINVVNNEVNNMARKLGSKDKVKRKSRNILGTVAKVGAGVVGAGLVGGANALKGGIQGGLIGGGVNAVRKYQYDRDNAR